MKRKFPNNFLWGTATSAYQIEGAACEDGKGPSIWDTYCAKPGRTYEGQTGDIACDHYHRYLEDIALMKEIGLKAYRFSIAWSRIFPKGRGKVNTKGIEFYRSLAGHLRDAGIEPMATLYHWDHPQALEDEGGWPSPKLADYFADYAEVCFNELGDLIKLWITFNEPRHSAFFSYSMDRGAPGGVSPEAGLNANHTILIAHGLAVQRFRECKANDGKIGITLDPSPMHPASNSKQDIEATRRRDLWYNRIWLDPVLAGKNPEPFSPWVNRCAKPSLTKEELAIASTPIDFLGINYYSVETVAYDPYDMLTQSKKAEPPNAEMLAAFLKMEICPEGMSELFNTIYNDYGKIPLYITENGLPTEEEKVGPDGIVLDDDRIDYLKRHMIEAHKTIEHGFDLRGYFVWSLLDNIEWKYGSRPLLGIIQLDYKTQKRTIKKSGYWYKEVIAVNGLDT